MPLWLWWEAIRLGNPYMGVSLAILSGILLGLLHVLFVVKFHANQIVVGVAVNIFTLGLTTIGLVSIWGNRGKSDAVNGLPCHPLELAEENSGAWQHLE